MESFTLEWMWLKSGWFLELWLETCSQLHPLLAYYWWFAVFIPHTLVRTFTSNRKRYIWWQVCKHFELSMRFREVKAEERAIKCRAAGQRRDSLGTPLKEQNWNWNWNQWAFYSILLPEERSPQTCCSVLFTKAYVTADFTIISVPVTPTMSAFS